MTSRHFASFLFFSFSLFSSAIVLSSPIYIDVSDLDNPRLSGPNVWYSGATPTGTDAFNLYVNVSGSHRGWPATGTSRVIFEDLTGDPVFGLRLYSVNWSELYWDSTYYFELFTVDNSGVYSGPDWSSYPVTTLPDNGTWQLAYSGIRTNLSNYDVYVMGPSLDVEPVPIPTTFMLFVSGLGAFFISRRHTTLRA